MQKEFTCNSLIDFDVLEVDFFLSSSIPEEMKNLSVINTAIAINASLLSSINPALTYSLFRGGSNVILLEEPALLNIETSVADGNRCCSCELKLSFTELAMAEAGVTDNDFPFDSYIIRYKLADGTCKVAMPWCNTLKPVTNYQVGTEHSVEQTYTYKTKVFFHEIV